MAEGIQIKELPPQPVLTIREKVPAEQLGDFFGISFSKLFPYMAAMGEAPIGPPFALYHSEPGPDGFDVEVCVPTPVVVNPTDDIASYELAGGRFLSAFHMGAYEDFGTTYDQLKAWLSEHGYRIVGPAREVYVVGVGQVDDPSEYITEILLPVESA